MSFRMQHFRERDERKMTLLRARIRGECGWSDAIISNVSRHGVGLKGGNLPDRGSFIEICSGPARVVGQVRWSSDNTCGVRTCEVVDLGFLLHGASEPTKAIVAKERRKSVRGPTNEERAVLAKYWSRLIQFFFLLTFIGAGALLLGTFVFEVIHKPFQQGSKVLETGSASVGAPDPVGRE